MHGFTAKANYVLFLFGVFFFFLTAMHLPPPNFTFSLTPLPPTYTNALDLFCTNGTDSNERYYLELVGRDLKMGHRSLKVAAGMEKAMANRSNNLKLTIVKTTKLKY